jgi:hypothetical protein
MFYEESMLTERTPTEERSVTGAEGEPCPYGFCVALDQDLEFK